MLNTYKDLKTCLYAITDAQTRVIQDCLDNMDDNEFREIPSLLMTKDQKALIETYGIIMGCRRGDKDYTIYCIIPAIFKIIISNA